MTALAERIFPERHRAEYGTVVLLLVGWAAAFIAGLLVHAPVIHRTTVDHVGAKEALAHATPAQAVAAWGGGQEIDGGQVNPQLAGTTCVLVQSKQALVCYAG